MKIFNIFLIFLFVCSCSKSDINLDESFEVLNNKSIALLIENIEKENDIKIYYGKIVKKKSDYFFVGTNNKINITLDIEKLNRIKKIDIDIESKVPSLKECEYFLWLKMDSFRKENKEYLKDTGINWDE